MPSALAQSKERKGPNFAIWQPWLLPLPHSSSSQPSHVSPLGGCDDLAGVPAVDGRLDGALWRQVEGPPHLVQPPQEATRQVPEGHCAKSCGTECRPQVLRNNTISAIRPSLVAKTNFGTLYMDREGRKRLGRALTKKSVSMDGRKKWQSRIHSDSMIWRSRNHFETSLVSFTMKRKRRLQFSTITLKPLQFQNESETAILK